MKTYEYHRFLDEAGDATFYGKGKIPIIGTNGVSNVFILGMLHLKQDLQATREQIIFLQNKIAQSKYYQNVPSVKKRVQEGGFYFHAKDDLPEIRKEFFDFILGLELSFQAVAARKIVSLFEKKHNGKESEFYADLLSHLLKDKLQKQGRLVLNIAEKGSSTSIQNLEKGLSKAQERFIKKFPNSAQSIKITFNVQRFNKEPLLAISDYFCWAIQRVFEKGECRYYDYMNEKISLVVDLYDQENYSKGKNYYTPKNPLTEKNKVSPHTP